MSALVEARNLQKHYYVAKGVLKAVDGVSFSIARGETVGLVGESGCGKSTVGRTALRLIEATGGELRFNGENIFEYDQRRMQALRREVGIIFQNPYSSLNPRMSILDIIAEPLRTHEKLSKRETLEKVVELVEQVGMKPEHLVRFPHQFSGGQRQRIAISRSLALKPQFLVLDEPTSALDVSVQAQLINLLKELQRTKELTYLFITHDLNIVHHIADRIMVMYLGAVVEMGSVEALFANPLHPYTEALLEAMPSVDPSDRKPRQLLEGEVPSPIDLPRGCRFQGRCRKAAVLCREVEPELQPVGSGEVACHFPNDREK